MTMTNKNITTQSDTTFHIGNLIKTELQRQGRTITWLAQQLGCTRDNLYKIFHHYFINTDLLFKISEAMNHDFFADCSDIMKINLKKKRVDSVNKKV